jgi:hypothetical protein
MLYIQIDVTLIDHPKLKKLARLLGVSRVAAVGHLAALWAWAAQYAPDGDLTTYLEEPEALAEAAMWEGNPQTFFDALVGARFGDGVGFLEVTVAGALILHDWSDFFGRVQERRAANAERMRRERAGDQGAPPIPEARARTQPAQPAAVAPTCNACASSPDTPCTARAEASGELCNARATHADSTCTLNNNKTTTKRNNSKTKRSVTKQNNSNNTARARAATPDPVVAVVVDSDPAPTDGVDDVISGLERLDFAPQQLAALSLLIGVAPDYVNPIAFVRANNPKLIAYWALYIGDQPPERLNAIDNVAGLINAYVRAGTFPQVRPVVRQKYDELVDKFLYDPGDPDIAEFITWLIAQTGEADPRS